MGRVAVAILAALLVASCRDNKSADKSGAPADKVAAGSSDAFTAAQRDAIAAIVRKTLIDNPEILVEVQDAYNKKAQEEEERQQKVALVTHADTLFRSKTSPVAGNPSGDVTVVEFFDYNCPHCRDGFLGLKKVLDGDKNVRFVFKEYPIFGGDSVVAAKIALAANMQGRYFDYHSALFASPGRITAAQAMQKAADIGLDMERLRKDMQSPEVTATLHENQMLAGELGVRGTPGFFVGNKFISGAPDDLAEEMAAFVADIRKNGCEHC
jgi:protein-disulfide isomerase